MNEWMPSAAAFAESELTGMYQEHRFFSKPSKHFPSTVNGKQYFSDMTNAARFPGRHFQALINGKSYFVKLAVSSLTATKEEVAAKLGIALGINVLPIVKFQQCYGHYVAAPVVKGKDLRSLLSTDIGKSETQFYQSEILLKASIAELSKTLVFDFLIGNDDRHYGNVYKADSGKLYLIDHELSFGNTIVLHSGNVFRYTLKVKRHLDEPIEPDFQAEAIAVAENFEPCLQENGLDVAAFKQRIEKLKSSHKLSDLCRATTP